MSVIKSKQPINAVPLFLCEINFMDDCEATIDLNISDVLQPYETLGEMFDDIIESISNVLVSDALLLCEGLTLIFDEERLTGTGFALEHMLLENNTCCVEFDEDYYRELTEDCTREQQIKLDFLIELFLNTSNSTHELISDLLGRLTDCMNEEKGGN